MDYYEFSFTVQSEETDTLIEILIAQLGEQQFESFKVEGNTLFAYIKSNLIQNPNDCLPEILHSELVQSFHFSHKLIKTENWNKLWESNFQPIVIDQRCIIKAPFHEIKETYEYELLIEPKMSFGTGHHETTSLMVKEILDRDFKGKNVLDMGCGTGVLGILCSMKGAKKVIGIDVDEWAYENTIENIKRNNIITMSAFHGNVSLLGSEIFNVILANINLNILLEDSKIYSDVLSPGGELIYSGIYEHDLSTLRNKVEAYKLSYCYHKTKNNWITAVFKKQS